MQDKFISIVTQTAAMGIAVPVGKTAAAVRAMGIVVPVHIDDDCRLFADKPSDKIEVSHSDGVITGYHWLPSRRWDSDPRTLGFFMWCGCIRAAVFPVPHKPDFSECSIGQRLAADGWVRKNVTDDINMARREISKEIARIEGIVTREKILLIEAFGWDMPKANGVEADAKESFSLAT